MPGSDSNFLADPGTFRLWTRDVLRFADTDRLGHVNNAAFATFCESGRVAFIWDPDAPLAQPGRAFVIVRLVIDFRAELHWPGAVDIGSTVLRIGNRSFTLGRGRAGAVLEQALAEHERAAPDAQHHSTDIDLAGPMQLGAEVEHQPGDDEGHARPRQRRRGIVEKGHAPRLA